MYLAAHFTRWRTAPAGYRHFLFLLNIQQVNPQHVNLTLLRETYFSIIINLLKRGVLW